MSASRILKFFGFSRITERVSETVASCLGESTVDRTLLKVVKQESFHRIVEIGVGDGDRAERLIKTALGQHDSATVRYTGIDLFEARGAATSCTLKEIHRRLVAHQVAVRLVPGDAASALPRCANDLRGTDLVVVRNDQDPSSLERAWHFLPRMLHQTSQVWLETEEAGEFSILTPREISARLTGRRRQAA